MTEERRPLGQAAFEPWVDRQVREAIARGEFDDLPGRGKPLTGIDGPHDEMWWLREKLRCEELSYLPPTLALRKEAEESVARALRARTEAEVRAVITSINEKIRRANRAYTPGPPLNLMPYDENAMVARWRAETRRSEDSVAPDGGRAGVTTGSQVQRRRWWGRRRPSKPG